LFSKNVPTIFFDSPSSEFSISKDVKLILTSDPTLEITQDACKDITIITVNLIIFIDNNPMLGTYNYPYYSGLGQEH
jgi:hypothetical protein